MPLHRTLAGALLGGALSAACAAPTAAPAPAPAPSAVPAVVPPADPCVVGDSGRDSLIVVLETAVSRDLAPIPANVAERFAFRQRYETLVRLDCTGAVRPGLAERWTGDSSGTVWTFELGERRFSGGDPVTAERIISSWTRDGLATRRNAIVAVAAPDARTLVVTLDPTAEGPAILADAELAVAGPRGPDGWPEGTRDSLPSIELRTAEGADLRDLLAGGVDLAVTRDPDAIAYAQRLPEFRVEPLPWDRRYWLVSAPPFASPSGADSSARDHFRNGLVRDVVSAASRPADAGARVGACLTRIDVHPPSRRRVTYLGGDRTGRELAERLVALAGRGFTLAAAGEAGLGLAILNDPDAAYVLPFPILPHSRCRQVTLPDYFTIEPLVDTRAHLILRRGAARVTVDADGVPRILPPGSP